MGTNMSEEPAVYYLFRVLYPEDGSSRFLRIVDNNLPNCAHGSISQETTLLILTAMGTSELYFYVAICIR
jgi:hypothetical protein